MLLILAKCCTQVNLNLVTIFNLVRKYENILVIFQQWMEREGRQAVRQKIAQMSTHLVNGPGGGAGVSGSGAQKQPQKDQGPQQESARRDLTRGKGRVTEAFVATTGLRQKDTSWEAATRAAAALVNAKTV